LAIFRIRLTRRPSLEALQYVLQRIEGLTARPVVPHKLLFQTLCVVLICALACSFILTAQAGIRGPGKYCGVIVFDRWDTCFLLSGHFITYVSNAVKNPLRPYKGTAMQVDASDVFQPMNPGDALIRKYEIIGPDGGGKVIGLSGFGNLNRYTARLVPQSVSEISPQEIDYVKGGVTRIEGVRIVMQSSTFGRNST
jgi:hypothetical protein